MQKARIFTIVPVSSSAIFSVSGNAVGWVNRNTIVMVKLNSLFRETPVRLKKLYRRGNEKEKNVQADSNF